MDQAPSAVVVADFDGDHKLDVAVLDGASNDLSLLFGDGMSGFSSPLSVAAGQSPFGMASGDFNGDQLPDLVITEEVDNQINILTNKLR